MFTLKEYLDNGNQLIIVSDLTGHDTTVDFILDEVLDRFYEYNNFSVYLVTKEGNSTFNIKKFSDKITGYYTENGINYLVYKGHKIGLLERKIDIFNIKKNCYDLEKLDLFTVGNSSTDIPMLVKCLEVGGRSSLIHNVFYTNKILSDQSINDIIFEKVTNECKLLKESELLKIYPNYSSFDKATKRKIKQQFDEFANEDVIKKRNDYFSNRVAEIYRLLRAGEVDIDFMQKQNLVFAMVEIATHHYLEKKTMVENQWDKILIYPTFRDYYNNLLNKFSKENIERKANEARILKI